MKQVAILQSNYIPWKGYFDLIAAVDEFILYDDMQYTRRDWRNRNQIKTPQGVQWLTVPVLVKGKYHQKIRDTENEGADWESSHWKALVQNYRRTPCFGEIAAWFEPLYLAQSYTHLSQFSVALVILDRQRTPLRQNSCRLFKTRTWGGDKGWKWQGTDRSLWTER